MMCFPFHSFQKAGLFTRRFNISVFFLLLSSLFSQTVWAQKSRTITVQNNSAVSLQDKPIVIKRKAIPRIPKNHPFPLLLSEKGDTIPSQLDDLNGDGKWDELFFVCSLPPNATQNLSLQWVTSPPSYKIRTSIRFGKRMNPGDPVLPSNEETSYARDVPKSMGFQRYQTDGPSWENDLVGFRHYLDGRNAKDVFGKLTPEISPESVGIGKKGEVEDNYHVMAPWGRDVFAVGNSIGIGGIALIKDSVPLRLGITVDDSLNNVEKTNFRIVTEGPVRSSFAIGYRNWKPAGTTSYQVQENTSIWPGMYAYHNSVQVKGTGSNTQLAIGMVNIQATHPPIEIRIGDRWVALISHDKHTYNKEWWLGIALILPAEDYLGFTEAPKTGKLASTYLAKMKISNRPVSYYAVACWEGSDPGFKDPIYFRNYVEKLTREIDAEVIVTVK